MAFRQTGKYGKLPRAAVCRGGHVQAWFVYAHAPAPHCMKCGEPVITECPNPECSTPLPADDNMGEWVTEYHQHCPACGKPYPWRADAIERARRSLEEAAEVEDWNVAVKDRALELVGEIAADKASGSSVATALRWIEQRGGKGAKSIILDVVKSIGTDALETALRSHDLLPLG